MSEFPTTGPGRRGSFLIVVVGLSVMALSLSLTYFIRITTSVDEASVLLREGQMRLALHAAAMYVQESSRLGWSDEARETSPITNAQGWRGHGAATPVQVGGVTDRGGETFGWTDVRTGWLGPLGPRDPATGAIPAPRWWRGSQPYRPLPDDSELPSGADRVWPCPGAVVRCELHRLVRPPYAVMGLAAPNPLRPAIAYGHVDFDLNWTENRALWDGPEYIGALDPQPAAGADTWNDYRAGVRIPVSGTENAAWFRVYRETLADHDNDGVPFYDHVAIVDAGHQVKNWNVFVITAGAGATRGYRTYAEAPPGLFIDSAHFAQLRAAESIAWYRVEWSGQAGGSWDPAVTGWSDDTSDSRRDLVGTLSLQANAKTIAGFTARSFGGHFRWVQRLDREPPTW